MRTECAGAVHLESKSNEQISREAYAFAKKNKKGIARRLTDPAIYIPEEKPVSVFMAGSPGAGKTEASKALIQKFTAGGGAILRIDPDELRSEFAGYDGANSWLFQAAASLLVEKVHDLAIKQCQSFVLDGTLSKFDVAYKNVRRSIAKQRLVQILYVYQNPRLAWEFVLAREKIEKRQIPADQFVDQYFAARDVVNRLKAHFQKEISVDLLIKDTDGSDRAYHDNVDKIDNYIPEKHTRESVELIVGLR